MQSMALSWLIYRLTHSSLLLGVVGFANAIPLLFISPFGGVLVDRFSKRKILILTQSGFMITAFLLAILTYMGHIQVWHIFLFTIINGAIAALDAPCRQSFMIELVGKQDLMNAIAMNSMSFNSARIVGPAVAGFSVAIIGEAGCFLINGISFVAVLISLFLMKPAEKIYDSAEESFWDKLKEGFAYVRGSKVLTRLLTLVSVPCLLSMNYATLMPVFAKDIFHRNADGLGILMSSVGVGAILGALIIARLSYSRHKGKTLILGGFGSAVTILLFGLSKNFTLSCLLLFLVGLSNVLYLTSTNTLIQSNAEDEYRGRAVSFYTLIFMGMMPIGSLLIGWVAEYLTAPGVTVLFAAITTVYFIFMHWKCPELYRLP
jgi:MFS family permease